MTRDELIILYHCLEWITFWWDNQNECLGNGQEEMEDVLEFAEHWWSMEKDAYPGAQEPDTVNYSAAVFCGEIDEETAVQEYPNPDKDKLLKHIKYDLEYYTKKSGENALALLPDWVCYDMEVLGF